LLVTGFSSFVDARAQAAPPVRVAIVGLVHGHVQGFLHNLASHPEINLVGICDPDPALRQEYIAQTHLSGDLFLETEAEMLKKTPPQAILVSTSIAGHRAAIEEAAPLH